jgi:lysophospholipase L1-like esterase
MQIPLSCIPTKRSEEWWLLRHAEKSKSAKPFDLIFVGDSIVHAWESEGKLAWQTHFGHLTTLNLGYAGDRTEHALWRLQNGELDNINAKFVVLLIGTNNAGHRHDKPEEIASGIKHLMGLIGDKIPNCKIVLTAIFPRSRNKHRRMRKIVDKTNDIIQTFADNNSVIWLDINAHFLDADGVLHETVMPDLLHPKALQYEIWGEILAKLLLSNTKTGTL